MRMNCRYPYRGRNCAAGSWNIVMIGVNAAMIPNTVELAPMDFAYRMMGAPIITWKATALKKLNVFAFSEPGG